MEKLLEKAVELHQQGYNCAQAVALPFCEKLGVEESLIKCATEGFGAGMGNRLQTCGALSGAIMVAGLAYADKNEPVSKQSTYAICARISEQFVAECGSSICAEIKGENGKPLYSCEDCIACGVRLAAEALAK